MSADVVAHPVVSATDPVVVAFPSITARPCGGAVERARQAVLLRLPMRAWSDHLHGDGGVA